MVKPNVRRSAREMPVTFKSVGDTGSLGEGQFTALVSVFGNVDCQDEVIMPGAFAESLAAWKASGNPIPVIWSHEWDDPMAHIGEVLEAEETATGLQVTAQLDMTNPTAVQVFKLLKDHRVTEFSIGGEESNFTVVDSPDGAVYQVGTFNLFELGPCLKGANPATQLISTKSEEIAADKSPGDDVELKKLVQSIVHEELAHHAPPGERSRQEPSETETAIPLNDGFSMPEITAWAAETESTLLD